MNKILKICCTIFILPTFLLYLLTPSSMALSPSSEPTYAGIDVSGYQGNIDYSKVAQAGIKIVYMKSSEGSNYVDSHFERNYTEAKRNGLKVGVYHFLTARSIAQAETQAQFFVSLISGKNIDCKLAMDFESFGNLNKQQINDIAIAFINKVKELSKKDVVVYSNTYAATYRFEGEVTNYPLWVAQYGVNEPQDNGNWSSWVGWQYADDGEVNGINARVDMNRFTKEILLDDTSEVPDIEDPNEGENNNGNNNENNNGNGSEGGSGENGGNSGNGNNNAGTKTIIIKWGDTLSQIALDYNTTVRRLVELNNIEDPNLIYAGESLIVPTTNSSIENIYIVRSGDTLSQIALNFNTTVNAIAKLNGITNVNLIYTGQKLIIPGSGNSEDGCIHDCGHKLYTVKSGDTLWSISRRYGTSIANIVRLNRIGNPNLIYPGQVFRI